MGRDAFLAGVEARQERVDEAQQLVETLRAESAIAETLTSGDLLTAWPELTVPEQRTLLNGLLDRVVLRRDKNSRHKTLAQPLASRVEIIVRGGTQLQPVTQNAQTSSAA